MGLSGEGPRAPSGQKYREGAVVVEGLVRVGFRWFRDVLVVAGVLTLFAFGSGLVPIPLTALRDTVAGAIEETIGARISVDGSLSLRLGLKPMLEASRVEVHLPTPANEPLLAIEQLSISPYLLDLLAGRLHFRALRAIGVVVDYCAFPQWSAPSDVATVDPADDAALPSLAVDVLVLDGVSPSCHDVERVLPNLPERLDLQLEAGLASPMRLNALSWKGDAQLSLTAGGPPLTRLLRGDADYPLKARIRAFESELTLDGVIRQLWSEPELDAEVAFTSASVSKLLDQLGIAVPLEFGLDAIEIVVEGVLRADEFDVRHAEGVVLEQRLRLSGAGRNLGSRPHVVLDVQAEQLDLDRLAPLLDGAEPPEGGASPTDLGSVYAMLDRMDGTLMLRVDRLHMLPWVLEDVQGQVSLEAGRLALHRLAFDWEGGRALADGSLDVRSECPILAGGLRIEHLDLAALARIMGQEPNLVGRAESLALSASACGETWVDLLASAAGHASLSGLRAALGEGTEEVSVAEASADLGWTRPGRLELRGQLLSEPVTAEIEFGPLGALAPGERWPVTVEARSRSSFVRASGDLALLDAGPELVADVALDVRRFGDLQPWIGADPQSRVPLSWRSRMRVKQGLLEFSALQARLGSSDVRGHIELRSAETNLPSAVALQSRQLNLEEFVTLFPSADDPAAEVRAALAEEVAARAWVDRWFSFPSVDVDLTAARVDGVNLDLTDVILRGRLRDRLIENGRLEGRLEEIDIAGDVAIDLRGDQWTTRYRFDAERVDLGRLLARLNLAQDVEARAQHLDFLILSQGGSLAELVVNTRTEVRVRSLEWIERSEMTGETYVFDLSELDLLSIPSQPMVWTSTGTLNGTSVKLWMQTPKLREVRNAARPLPFKLAIGAGEGVTLVQALVEPAAEEALTVQIDVSGAIEDPAAVDFAELEGPLGGYRIQSTVQVRGSEISARDVRVRVRGSEATGQLDVRREGDHFHIGGRLRASVIETDDLVEWVRRVREIGASTAELPDPGPREADPAGPKPRLFPMIDAYLRDLTERNTVDFLLDVDELYSAGVALGDARAGVYLSADAVSVDPFWVHLPDGAADASYHSRRAEGGFEYDLDVDIEELQYGGPLRLIDPDTTADGELFLDLSVVSRAAEAASVAANLQGYVDLVIFPENVSADFLDLWASNLILALLPSIDGKEKHMNCMVARFEVEDGVMKARKVFLDSTDIIVRARGTIDLATRKLDLLIAPQAKRERFLSVSAPLAVTGSFDDYHVYPAPTGFLTMLVRLYYGLIYVPWKWLTGARFPADGVATCYNAMGWDPPDGGMH